MASDKRAATRQKTRTAAKRETAAQRKAREEKAKLEAAESADAEAAVADAVEVRDTPPPGEEGQLNAVVLHRGFNENGVPIVAIQTSGDVRISEVEHIVKTALKQVKEEFGFD